MSRIICNLAVSLSGEIEYARQSFIHSITSCSFLVFFIMVHASVGPVLDPARHDASGRAGPLVPTASTATRPENPAAENPGRGPALRQARDAEQTRSRTAATTRRATGPAPDGNPAARAGLARMRCGPARHDIVSLRGIRSVAPHAGLPSTRTRLSRSLSLLAMLIVRVLCLVRSMRPYDTEIHPKCSRAHQRGSHEHAARRARGIQHRSRGMHRKVRYGTRGRGFAATSRSHRPAPVTSSAGGGPPPASAAALSAASAASSAAAASSARPSSRSASSKEGRASGASTQQRAMSLSS